MERVHPSEALLAYYDWNQERNLLMKIQMDKHEECPKCKQVTMPRWSKDESATARACQNPDCKHVEER